jgi:hypothetical protein
MRVEVKTHVGARRVVYDVRWRSWALPLSIALGTSFLPTADSGMDISKWDVQRVLIIRVLCVGATIVVYGPLLADYDGEDGDDA